MAQTGGEISTSLIGAGALLVAVGAFSLATLRRRQTSN
ncbi:LPXTG cell wall anchor domain-containing protein [Microbacterium stercoris]|uniref:LPXTG cell wall anchor domain-containing protein n=1 Tax=Microbacterium stercoris TaxID=2820289 RepID=A0A939QIS7_9MICO|nr:LPXTG cell wall anchor domain-containing protein [Microbacterium stercoris]